MNNKQIYLMWGIILAFLLVALFPPMDVTTSFGKNRPIVSEGNIRWRFIFANSQWRAGRWSTSPDQLYHQTANHIKSAAWTIEFIVLGVVSAGLWLTFQKGVQYE